MLGRGLTGETGAYPATRLSWSFLGLNEKESSLMAQTALFESKDPIVAREELTRVSSGSSYRIGIPGTPVPQ